MDDKIRNILLKESHRIYDRHKDKLYKKEGLSEAEERTIGSFEKALKETDNPNVRRKIGEAMSSMIRLSENKVSVKKIENEITKENESRIRDLIKRGVIPKPERDGFIKKIGL